MKECVYSRRTFLHENSPLCSTRRSARRAALALGRPGPATGQVLPAPPPLAISDNVEVIGNVPGSLFGMHFKGNYGYATGATGLTVFDVAEAANPTIVGELPLPHFENEDVDACGNTLVIASDAVNPAAPLYVIDISNPALPALRSVYNLGLEGTGNGAGHIANFVSKDCSQLGWTADPAWKSLTCRIPPVPGLSAISVPRRPKAIST